MISGGVTLGRIVALNNYVKNYIDLVEEDPALPSRILDIHNNLVAEFTDEDRQLINYTDLPRNLIHATLAREDKGFYRHRGFSIYGTTRALVYQVLNRLVSAPTSGGGSTLSQQLAGRLRADRTELSIKRKLIELWWSCQFERDFSKEEIIENYLNIQYFGERNYGVASASEFFFNHSVTENTIAESSLLVIQLARPNGDFSPLRNPENAKLRQRAVLKEVVDLGFMSEEEVENSYNLYWDEYDYSRFIKNVPKQFDKAPFFSEYVKHQLEAQLFGDADIYRNGYTIYSTLDMRHQQLAEDIVAREMEVIDTIYERQSQDVFKILEYSELPFLLMTKRILNLQGVVIRGQNRRKAREAFQDEIAPVFEMLTLTLDQEAMRPALKSVNKQIAKFKSKNVPEVAMTTIDNTNGHITMMIGGREFVHNQSNQFNRASDSALQPGSVFKPIYYSAAVSEKKITPATQLIDAPYAFQNPDGSYYYPRNYGDSIRGKVLVRDALALSLNIPAVQVMQSVGFDNSINRAAALFGITDRAQITKLFPKVYPLALGITSVSPLQLGRAFSVFANAGRVREPIAIRYVEDRNGMIILNREAEARESYERPESQIMTPQEAYIMTNMMQSTIRMGTLYGVWNRAGRPNQPMAGKTGTTDNWADGWTVGYTPYFTSVVWVGFDTPGNSLGPNLYGARAAGPMWMDFMNSIHGNLEVKNFERPDSGISYQVVCKESGLVWVDACGTGNKRSEVFLGGTAPTQECPIHGSGFSYVSSAGDNRDTPVDSEPAGINSVLEGLDPALRELIEADLNGSDNPLETTLSEDNEESAESVLAIEPPGLSELSEVIETTEIITESEPPESNEEPLISEEETRFLN